MTSIKKQIKGNFEGFKDTSTIFEMIDGSKWQQDEYKYVYSFSFMPQVEIIEELAVFYLKVNALRETVRIKKVFNV